MSEALLYVVRAWLKILFIFTPFLILSIFLGMTRAFDPARQRAFALRATVAVGVICYVVYFFGSVIFALFGITLDAFRIGAGALLFLSSISLVQGKAPPTPDGEEDLVIVPFAMPIIVGPAVMGVLFVLGADVAGVRERALGALAVGLAVLSLGALLLVAARVERWLGKDKLEIISKVTGLILAALAAQMIFTGARHFLVAP
jgi:multiple antibiotic resistance protein